MVKNMADILRDIEAAGLENEIEDFFAWRAEQQKTKRADEEEKEAVLFTLLPDIKYRVRANGTITIRRVELLYRLILEANRMTEALRQTRSGIAEQKNDADGF